MDYPIIDFKKKIGLRATTGRGYLIGQYLVVAPAIGNEKRFQIYKLHDGRLLISAITFLVLEDAIEIAEWLDEKYKDFFLIWETHPEADIFALCKWTVRNGIQIYEFLDILKGRQSVNKDVLSGAYVNAEERVKEWTRE